jgi:hypothetical protein
MPLLVIIGNRSPHSFERIAQRDEIACHGFLLSIMQSAGPKAMMAMPAARLQPTPADEQGHLCVL